ncbi:Spermatogenesis-associated protein 5-like protein 1 [Orchesella cincta]|uniref:Spermatogenesis-associated protein 5-like protein 1 n=1 Tax=Orchesella cincta TaxID=48709 RepID=A0A1D2NEY2_ORCCI|nr:Spermatogenesis-associated protein 5-like protein 1 [Orchesella cincta]
MSQENWKRKGEELLMVGRGRNDYSEIDLARHVAEMEAERTGGGVTTTRSGLAVAEKNFLFDELPSTVRFNDALVCTSKDIQILKSESAAKMLHSLIEIQGRQLLAKQRDDSSVVGLTEFSHGFLISGPSGCGKVFVVRETAKKLGAHLLCFNPVGGSGTSSGFLEHVSHFCQQLSEIFMSALVTASRYPTVLLLPRIHLLFQKQQWQLTLVSKIFWIIISPPKESERLQILQEMSKDLPQFKNVDLSMIASQTPGYVGQDLLKLLRLALFKCAEENCSQVGEHHVKYSVGRVLPSVLQGALGVVDIQRAISLDHIAGLHSVKLDLIKAIVWPLNHPHAFLRMGISPPKGILLYGPPGNCKTTLVRAVAASHQTNFLSVSAAELFSSGVGDSEKIVAHLFHRARMASPCILFIDELESIVGNRQNSQKKQTSTNESILSMLLTEMDGVGVEKIQDATTLTTAPSFGPLVLVVAATNRPDLIDPALLRPGRFDKLIPVPPLDINGRKELLEFCSKSIPFHPDVNFVQVAKVTEYFSGADLVNLCREAALFALSEDMSAPFVTEEHVRMAKRVVGPSLNPAMLRSFHEYGSKRSCC